MRVRFHIARMGIAAIVLAVAAMPLFSSPVFAHAALVRANPSNNETLRRAPLRITLNFSEAIEQQLTSIQVVDKDKNRVDSNDVAFDPSDPTFASVGVKALDPGLYFVKWSNVSAVDGHDLKGTYPFIVLNSDGTFPVGVSLDNAQETSGGNLLPSNLDSALKWIALLSLATVAGAAFFLVAVLRPAAAFLEEDDYHDATDAGERWLIAISHVLLPAAFIAWAVLVLLAVNRFETTTTIWEYLTSIRTGQYRLAQLILLVVALAGADLLFLGGSHRDRNIGLGVLLATTVGALFCEAMVSHAATGNGKFWSVGSDFIHLVASSAWLGALAMLFAFLRWQPRMRELRNDDSEVQETRFLYLANIFDRFSSVAALSVIAIFATGTFNGLAEVPNAGAMIHTTYGKVLLAKIALLAPLLAIAGVNAFYFKPRLVAAIDGLYQRGGLAPEHERATWRTRLQRLQQILPATVAAEIVLIIAVFATVGVLTQTSTAAGEEAYRASQTTGASKFSQTVTQADLKLSLEVSPNRVGINEYDLVIQNADGSPSATVSQARLRFTYTDAPDAVAPSEIILNKFATGEYKGAGAYFTQPGNWRVDTSVKRSDADDVTQALVLPVGKAEATAASKGGSAYSLPFKVFSWNEVVGAMLAIVGGVILIYRRQIGALRPWAYRAGVTAATVTLLAAAVLAFGVHSHSNAVNLTGGNPKQATADSVAAGKQLFQQNCITCHGIDGRGDGPESVKLNPPPTDFRLHMPLHTDPQFYAFIADGYQGTQMPAFGTAFSADDIWNLVNYLRSAFTEAPSQ